MVLMWMESMQLQYVRSLVSPGTSHLYIFKLGITGNRRLRFCFKDLLKSKKLHFIKILLSYQSANLHQCSKNHTFNSFVS